MGVEVTVTPFYNAEMTSPNDLLTTAQVAEMAGVKAMSIHQYRQRGAIPEPDQYIGRTPVWKRRTIEKWLESRPPTPQRRAEDEQ